MARNTGTAVGFSFLNLASQATNLVRSGSGILHSITLNGPVATGTIAIYDGLTAGGTLIATITVPASPFPVTLTYDVAYDTGLTIVTATATNNITVSFI